MNAAPNGHCLAAHTGIVGNVRTFLTSIQARARWNWLPLFIVLIVAGCTTAQLAAPTMNTPEPTVSPAISPASQIAVERPAGQPDPMAMLLANNVVSALIQRGFPARIADGRPALFVISGKTETLDEQYAPIVAALHWTLFNSQGQEIAYLNQQVRGIPDDWAYGSPAMLQTIGHETAADLSPFLGQPSIVAHTSDQTPEPAPVPEEEVTEQLASSADLVPLVANQNTATQYPAVPPPVVPSLPIAGANPGFVDFGIWVDDVTGAPGDGNNALTRALLYELKRAALPFAMTAGTASHFVQGVVDVSVLDATTEHVTILWVVSNAEGKELGRITQRNDIARGTLHQNWGKTAQYAAMGGADAVLAIIERDLTKE